MGEAISTAYGLSAGCAAVTAGGDLWGFGGLYPQQAFWRVENLKKSQNMYMFALLADLIEFQQNTDTGFGELLRCGAWNNNHLLLIFVYGLFPSKYKL